MSNHPDNIFLDLMNVLIFSLHHCVGSITERMKKIATWTYNKYQNFPILRLTALFKDTSGARNHATSVASGKR